MYMADKNPATPGQIRLGKSLEKKLGVPGVAWESLTQQEARARNSLLLDLNKQVHYEGWTILRYWPDTDSFSWHPDHRRLDSML